jgi:hypothetical protein
MQGMERELNKGKVKITGNACWGYRFVACQVGLKWKIKSLVRDGR